MQGSEDLDRVGLSTKVAVWTDDQEFIQDNYYVNPDRFIPNSAYDFIREMDYYEKFGNAPEFKKSSSRFIDAVNLYKYYVSYWQNPTTNKEGFS